MDVSFENSRGENLAGVIDQVENPIAQAIFSHCFTCSKDHAASYRICKALADQGIQVLRFDFEDRSWNRQSILQRAMLWNRIDRKINN